MTTHNLFAEPDHFRKHLVWPVAKGLYRDFRRRSALAGQSHALTSSFTSLTKQERQFWVDYVSAIPEKYASLGLFLRQYVEFCRTCIITDNEISALTEADLKRFGKGGHNGKRRAFFTELNYLIPASLMKAGYEIVRHEEITDLKLPLLKKIARAIHSRYLHGIMNQETGRKSLPDNTATDFDQLPAEIRQSNIDNAAHISAKLLSIGYRIRPVKKGYKPLVLHLDDAEVETMARVEHLRWSWEKRLNGWIAGKKKDTVKKIHPSLVPFDQLDEAEKEKDRQLVRLIPALLQDINYEAYPVSPERISRLSYAIRPQSSIHKLLASTNELSAGIAALVGTNPEIIERLQTIDEKIRLTISEVEGSYNYARHIQESFLPEGLYIRECFPESFVLFHPKDIVSGDFYLFSRHGKDIVFGLADCTGHGIPASLISTIGFGILDQAVNILKITDPADALSYLYSGIHRFLRNDPDSSGVPDDLMIILCRLDTTTRIMTFSGVGNILLHVSGGRISGNLSPGAPGEEMDMKGYRFASSTLSLKPNDAIYLCSDGFADQFGGSSHKRYTRKRLSDFLLTISNFTMPEQGDLLYGEYERWREEKDEDQTDDITIIGIRL